jgi:hypothetical protein
MSGGPKEDAYDELISPLMGRIIEICKAHGINAFATFALDEREPRDPLMCTTSLPLDDADARGFGLVKACCRLVYEPAPFVALTITTKRPEDQEPIDQRPEVKR